MQNVINAASTSPIIDITSPALALLFVTLCSADFFFDIIEKIRPRIPAINPVITYMLDTSDTIPQTIPAIPKPFALP